MDLATRTEELIRGVVEADGYELVHVDFQPKGAASRLRIYIDKPEGVTLGDCQRVSRQVGVLLDVEDLIPHHYTLEVSSPGIERPLFSEKDYRRFLGQEVRLTTVDKIEGRSRFQGRLTGLSDGRIEIECEDQRYEIPFQLVKKGNLVYHF